MTFLTTAWSKEPIFMLIAKSKGIRIILLACLLPVLDTIAVNHYVSSVGTNNPPYTN